MSGIGYFFVEKALIDNGYEPISVWEFGQLL